MDFAVGACIVGAGAEAFIREVERDEYRQTEDVAGRRRVGRGIFLSTYAASSIT